MLLVALYPKSTRIMQPADIAAFKPSNIKWNKTILIRWENPNSLVSKENFAVLFNIAINKLKSDSIVSGFKASGLFPWDKLFKLSRQGKRSKTQKISWKSGCLMLPWMTGFKKLLSIIVYFLRKMIQFAVDSLLYISLME